MSTSASQEDNGDMSINNENRREYYLIRVPKNVDIKELNGAEINLSEYGPSECVIQSETDPTQSYGYDIISPQTTTFSNLTRLTTTSADQIEIDPNFVLAGCINFYTHKSQPDNQLKPLIPVSPNDPIEDIVNRARGNSIKRKMPTKADKSSHKKSKGHKRVD